LSRARAKYEERGFEFADNDFENQPPASVFNTGPRRVGDWRSWVVVLDTRGVDNSELFAGLPEDFDPNFVNCWELQTDDETTHVHVREDSLHLLYTGMRMKCSLLDRMILRYRYTLSPSRRETLLEFLRLCSKVERQKLSKEVQAEIARIGDGAFKEKQMGMDTPSLYLYVCQLLSSVLHPHLQASLTSYDYHIKHIIMTWYNRNFRAPSPNSWY